VQIFDLFIVETPADALECASAGIFDITLYDMECENCAMAIGPTFDGFVPIVVVTDLTGTSQSTWATCVDCAVPLIFPGDWAPQR
jgi:hypothetical protein